MTQNCQTARKIQKQSSFDYQNIYSKKYIEGNGGIIRVTMEKGETYGGSISPDNKYLFFTSNKDGNFDIFMRPLNDIISIPIMRGSTNQTEPAISPDGKKLLFVDDELDPDGDIVSVKIKPDSVARIYSRSGQSAVDAMFIDEKKFITNDPENITRSRESNPAWSPGGDWIAYASNKASPGGNRFGPGFGARQNIWIMPSEKPDKARQLTQNGGIMPVFSPDEKKILYVNSDKNENISHIYEMDIGTTHCRQITNSSTIDLYPAYTADGKNIVFTRIYNDTNSDSIIDYRDHGQIMLLPLDTAGMTQNEIDGCNESDKPDKPVQLTSKNENIFNTRVTNFLGGSIIFAMKEGDDINLGVIPVSGIFPLKKSPIEQLEYVSNLAAASPENSLMAYEQIEYTHAGDPLKLFASTLRDFELLNRYKSLKLDKKKILNQIELKIANHDLFEKVMLDIFFKNHPDDQPEKYEFLFPEKSLEGYLRQIYMRPVSVLNSRLNSEAGVREDSESTGFKPETLSKNEQCVLGYLFELYAGTLFQKGKVEPAREIYQSVLYDLPEFYDNASILYSMGKDSFDTDIPPEFLHILFPNQYPYLIHPPQKEIPALTDENKPGKPEKTIKIIANEIVKSRVETDIFNFFKKAYSQNQEDLINSLEEKYSKTSDPFIYNLVQLALAENLKDHQRLNEALAALQEINGNSFLNSQWNYRFTLLKGQLLEKTNRIEEAYTTYANALMLYENKYNSAELNDVITGTFNYFGKLAEVYKNGRNTEKAWNAYSELLKLVLYLEPRKIAQDVVEKSSLSIFIQLDEMLLNDYNLENATVKSVLKFYSENIAFARKNTINSFIFGRAYLNAMLGIRFHVHYEGNRKLNIITKEKILAYFYEAEDDFQWSIYADSSFADSYLMLGWMYQFIDEKRDSNVYLSQAGNETAVDKDIFKSLYDKYFPEYLFEKNIQLYRKSIAFLSGKSPNQMLQKLYLNLANNYFLLNNYTKAGENYARISIDGSNKFIFESKTQEAQYYFHVGKTNYFLGQYRDAAQNLEKTLSFYPLVSQQSPASMISSFQKRSLILKYLGLVYSDWGQYNKSVDFYKQIIAEANNIRYKENLASIYLEISHNILSQIKVSHDLNKTNEALEYAQKAESMIKEFPEEAVPRFPSKIKILGLALPFNFYFGNYDRSFVNGTNHLAFRLPAINQFQYLYSIQTDLYKLNGNYSKATTAIKKLIDYAEKDDSKHGKETLQTAFMRLGELKYIEGNAEESRNAYVQAQKTALAENNIRSFYLAEKNLMTIICRKIENSGTPREKSELAGAGLKELGDFKKHYISLKLSAAQEEISKKNRKMKLSLAEQSRIEREAIVDIGAILLYQGVFETFKSGSDEISDLNERPLDFSAYYDYKTSHYNKNRQALSSLEGNLTVNNATIPLYDKKKRRQTAMILEMNKALVLESMGRTKEAMDIYSGISNLAYEFSANDLFIVSGYRSYSIAESLNMDAQKTLHNLDVTFKLNPYLVKKHPAIYQNLSEMIIRENINNKQFYNTIYLENFNRIMELQSTLDIILSNSDNELISTLNEYKELDKVEEILATDIENLKIKRENTDSLETILEQLLSKKQKLKETIVQNPKLAGFALARFPDLLTVNDIMNIKRGFLYLVYNEGAATAIYKYPDDNKGANKFELNSFKIAAGDIRKFAELIKNPENENPDNSNTRAKTTTELNRFIKWMQGKNFDIIFPDKIFAFFPFSKVLNRTVATEYTLQAAILFEKNQTAASTNWLQNSNNKIQIGEAGETNHYAYNLALKPDDVQKLKGSYNAVDYEITENDFSREASVLNKILNNNEKTSITLLSYNLKNNDVLAVYVNSLNLLFAASGSTMVVHSLQTRKSSSDNYLKILSHRNDFDEKIMFDSNPQVASAFFNVDKNESANRFIQYKIRDLRQCVSQIDNLIDDSMVQEAITKLNICENMRYDIEVSRLASNNELTPEQLKKIKPDFTLLYKKMGLMMNPKSGYKSSAVEKTFEAFKNNYVLSSQTSESELYDYQVKYISLLYANGETQMAANALKFFPVEYKLKKAEIFEIAGNYYLGQISLGNLQAFTNDLPAEILSLSGETPIFQETGSSINEKINYFIHNGNDPEKWYKSLINSGEYTKLDENFLHSNFKAGSWEAISLMASAGKMPPGKFDSHDADTIGRLMQNPGESDLYVKISNETNDEYIRRFANLIEFVKKKDFEKISGIINSLTNLKNNDAEYFIKQAFICYLINHFDYFSAPEEFMSNILKSISAQKFESAEANNQQKIFAKIVSSTISFINNPGELNKFLAAYPEGLSEVNIRYVQRLKSLSTQVNPYEALNLETDESNAAYRNAGFNLAPARLRELVGNSDHAGEIENPGDYANHEDLSYSTLYYLKSKNNQKALFRYFSYDRGQLPENFTFEKNLHGILKIYSDQYYHWSWNQKNIEFTKIRLSELEKILAQNKDDIFYLPAKDEMIREKLLLPENGLRYFTVAAMIKPKTDSETPASDTITWTYNPQLLNSPGYSIMRIYLPPPVEFNQPVRIAYNNGTNLNVNNNAFINFYSENIQLESLRQIENIGGLRNFHIVYRNPDILNIYLVFMKEFLKLYIEKNEGKSDDKSKDGKSEKIDSPTAIFNSVFKILEKKYAGTDDLKNIIIIQK